MTVWYKDKKIGGTRQKLHRYLWEQVNGPVPEGMTLDHIDGDTHNNDLSNLRLVTQQDNTRNGKLSKNNTSGVNGVVWNKRDSKWTARVKVDYKQLYLGQFDDWFEAVCARMSANNLYGFHENHGRR